VALAFLALGNAGEGLHQFIIGHQYNPPSASAVSKLSQRRGLDSCAPRFKLILWAPALAQPCIEPRIQRWKRFETVGLQNSHR
jgi:hypothetical protein